MFVYPKTVRMHVGVSATYVCFFRPKKSLEEGSISPTNFLGAKHKNAIIWSIAEKMPFCFTNMCAKISKLNLGYTFCAMELVAVLDHIYSKHYTTKKFGLVDLQYFFDI